jgi:hypothetical protein
MNAAQLSRRPLAVARARRNPVKSTKTFYVRSEADARKRYLVQRIRRGRRVTYFCNCLDFISRKLPHLDTNTFSGCKHVRSVRRKVGGR